MKERLFQVMVAKELIELGFGVFIDKNKGCRDIPRFKGSKKLESLKKPDLIVFIKDFDAQFLPKPLSISNPFGIELKTIDSYGKGVNQPIMQMMNYKERPRYLIEGKECMLGTILLGTPSSINNDIIYQGSMVFPRTNHPDTQYGIEWSVTRQLYSLSKEKKKLFFGLFKKDIFGFYIQFPNYKVRLNEHGRLGCVQSLVII